MNKWEGIFENWRRFLFITYQIKKTSLSFSKCVMVREILDIEVALQNVQKLFYNGATEFPVAVTVWIFLVGRLPPVKEDLNGFSRIN
jgi:hypothetical protein